MLVTRVHFLKGLQGQEDLVVESSSPVLLTSASAGRLRLVWHERGEERSAVFDGGAWTLDEFARVSFREAMFNGALACGATPDAGGGAAANRLRALAAGLGSLAAVMDDLAGEVRKAPETPGVPAKVVLVADDLKEQAEHFRLVASVLTQYADEPDSSGSPK